MKKILLILCALLGTVGAWADVTVTWESKSDWEQASGGVANIYWFGVTTPGSTTTEFTLDEFQIMQQQTGKDCYIAIATETSNSSLNESAVVAVSNNAITPSSSTATLETYTFDSNVTLTGGTTYYIVFLSSNTPTDGAYPVQQGRISLNHTDYGTYAPGCSNASPSSWWPYFTATLTTTVKMINVTYSLYESDGTTLISTKVESQEPNSDVAVPASFSSNTYFNYSTEGTIGTDDCEIKVIRTLKDATIVYPLSKLDNNKAYTFASKRGTFTTTDGKLANTVKSSEYEINNFAIISFEEKYFLWSITNSKFVAGDGNTLDDKPVAITINALSAPAYKFTCGSLTLNSTGGFATGGGFDSYSSTDDGNTCIIKEVEEDFDPTNVLAVLNDYYHPSYFITYIVKDTKGNTLFTSEQVGTTVGTQVTTLPEEYQHSAFYTYNTVNVTISTKGNTNVEFIATPKEEPVVQYTADATSPYFYNLNIRSKYLVYDDDPEVIGEVTLQKGSEPFNPNASWAFIGEPYAGFKVINKTKGTTSFLTYTSVVTGNNNGADGSNNNIQFVAEDDFENQYWLIDTNNNGIVLRMKENTDIYFHHQNVSNSNGYLRTCSMTEWSSVHNDAGSTIVASTDEDVLFALYESMKDMVFGDQPGQWNTTNPDELTNEQATTDLSTAATVISTANTSAYAECYASLIAIKNNVAMVYPEGYPAGFYRVKNVATDQYLTAIAESGYGKQVSAVFANSVEMNAATIIKLAEKDGNIYMQNQGHSFGWVYGSYSAWINANLWDKYVHWFPGTADNQIAFAICYGNGTGNYESYLNQGIYTAAEDGSVVAGSDYKIDGAQWIFEEATDIEIELNLNDGAYYATFYAPFGVVLPSDTEAYVVNVDGDYAIAELIGQEIPANVPVLIKGSDFFVTATINDDIEDADDENALQGCYLATESSKINGYVFGVDDEDVLGFYKLAAEKTLGANKAYLKPQSEEVKGFALDLATAIKAVEAAQQNGSIYNIAGQRVNKAQKGIYIVNGKKIIK